ncbi:hypothetical protein ACKWTF_016643 [Chironomus riparius]
MYSSQQPPKTFFQFFFLIIAVNSSFCVNLNCNFCLKSYEEFHNVYSCVQKDSLNIYNDKTDVDLVNGVPTGSDVNAVSINNNIVQYIPINLAQKFEYLIALQINNGSLNSISQNVFKEFKILQFLDLNGNDILSIDNDTFYYNIMLAILWLNNNFIATIGVNTFNDLKSLIQLDLEDNICISELAILKKTIKSFLHKVYKDCDLIDIFKSYQLIKRLRKDIKNLSKFSENLKKYKMIRDERINILNRQMQSLSDKQIELTTLKPNIIEIKSNYFMNLPKVAFYFFIICISIITILTILNIFLSFNILM